MIYVCIYGVFWFMYYCEWYALLEGVKNLQSYTILKNPDFQPTKGKCSLQNEDNFLVKTSKHGYTPNYEQSATSW